MGGWENPVREGGLEGVDGGVSCASCRERVSTGRYPGRLPVGGSLGVHQGVLRWYVWLPLETIVGGYYSEAFCGCVLIYMRIKRD